LVTALDGQLGNGGGPTTPLEHYSVL
jgi:hypothetical protein